MKIILVLLFVLSSCAGDVEKTISNARPYEVRHPIVLSKKNQVLNVDLDIEKGLLDNSQKAKIMSFIYGYDLNGVGDIILSVPEEYSTNGQARKVVKVVSETISSAGIDKSKMIVKTYTPNNEADKFVKVSFKSIIAEGPDCSDKWSKDFTDAFDNASSKGLGCITRSNLAAMIANPKDLIEMRDFTPGVSARRSLRINSYIEGQTSGVSANSTN